MGKLLAILRRNDRTSGYHDPAEDKYIYCPSDAPMLFNIAKDPKETTIWLMTLITLN